MQQRYVASGLPRLAWETGDPVAALGPGPRWGGRAGHQLFRSPGGEHRLRSVSDLRRDACMERRIHIRPDRCEENPMAESVALGVLGLSVPAGTHLCTFFQG